MKNKDLKEGDFLYVIKHFEIKHLPIYSLEKKPDSRFISVIMDYEADIGSVFFDSEDSRDFVISRCRSVSSSLKEIKKELASRIFSDIGFYFAKHEIELKKLKKNQELLKGLLKELDINPKDLLEDE